MNEQMGACHNSVSLPISEMSQEQVLAVQRDMNARRYVQSAPKEKKTVNVANFLAREQEVLNDLSRFSPVNSPAFPSWAGRARAKAMSYPNASTSVYTLFSSMTARHNTATGPGLPTTENHDTTKSMSGIRY